MSHDHLQRVARQDETSLKCIAFDYAPLDAKLTIDLAFEPSINELNGRSNVELQVRDVAFPWSSVNRSGRSPWPN